MLDATQMIAYATALGFAAAIPGPGMIALVARSASGGAITGFTMLAGLILGDLIYLSFAVFGLALIAHHFDTLFILITLGSSLYLAWLAWQFISCIPEAIEVDQKVTRRGLMAACLSGLMITLGNPKTIAFYLAILPLVITLDSVSLQTWGLSLVPLTIMVLITVGSVFILGALKVRRFLASQHAQVYLNRGAGVIMFGASATMITRLF